jgi:hypothetical protein
MSRPFPPISSGFTDLGVQVHITEMDVAVPVNADGNARAEDLQQQADIYRQIANACVSRSHRGCTAIQTWGFTDKYSWIGSHSKHTQGAALPFDRNYRAKPAYLALRNALAARAQRRLYRLKPEPFREVDMWLAQFRRFWSAHVDALERHLDRLERDRLDHDPMDRQGHGSATPTKKKHNEKTARPKPRTR